MTHTSGLPDSIGDEYDVMTRDDFLKGMFATPLEHPPGGRFVYSDAGYAMLAAVVEAVSGRPLGDFLHDQIFEPAGMHHTGLKPSAEDRRAPGARPLHAGRLGNVARSSASPGRSLVEPARQRRHPDDDGRPLSLGQGAPGGRRALTRRAREVPAALRPRDRRPRAEVCLRMVGDDEPDRPYPARPRRRQRRLRVRHPPLSAGRRGDLRRRQHGDLFGDRDRRPHRAADVRQAGRRAAAGRRGPGRRASTLRGQLQARCERAPGGRRGAGPAGGHRGWRRGAGAISSARWGRNA